MNKNPFSAAGKGAAVFNKKTAIDPVCKMQVNPLTAAARFFYQDTTYYFCNIKCKEKFAADPVIGPRLEMLFVAPPSYTELEKRLRGRGTDAEESIVKRLANAKGEMAYWKAYTYIVINNDLEEKRDDQRKDRQHDHHKGDLTENTLVFDEFRNEPAQTERLILI